MDLVVLGLVAGAITSAGFLPQLLRGLRTRHMADVSPYMLGLMSLGLGLWLVYGVLRQDVSIIFANALGLLLSGATLALWFRFGRARRPARAAS